MRIHARKIQIKWKPFPLMFKVSYFSLLNNKAQSKLVIIMYELDQMVCHFSIIPSPQMCSKIFTVIT